MPPLSSRLGDDPQQGEIRDGVAASKAVLAAAIKCLEAAEHLDHDHGLILQAVRLIDRGRAALARPAHLTAPEDGGDVWDVFPS